MSLLGKCLVCKSFRRCENLVPGVGTLFPVNEDLVLEVAVEGKGGCEGLAVATVLSFEVLKTLGGLMV